MSQIGLPVRVQVPLPHLQSPPVEHRADQQFPQGGQ